MMMSLRVCRSNLKSASLAAIAIMLSATGQAHGQTAGSNDADENQYDENEIVVTAQRRSESIQDVPISISAISGGDLERKGASGFEDYLREVPGVSFVPLGPGLGQLNIRGISTQPVARDQPGVKPSVGVYFDETPLGLAVFNPDLDTYDIERVEVLRGPQGTLFGSGSLSGTLRFITNKPNPSALLGSFSTGISSIENGDINHHAKAMANIPLSDDVAVRLVGYENYYGGFIDQVQTVFGGQTYGIAKDDVNSSRKAGGRVAIGVDNGGFKSVLTLIHQQIDSNGYPLDDIAYPNIPATIFETAPYSVPVRTGEDEQFRQRRESRNDKITLISSNSEYDVGFANIVSATSYVRRKLEDIRDLSTDLADFGLPLATDLVDQTSVTSFSQEVRVVSQNDGPFSWLVGLFYSDQQRGYHQYFIQPGIDDYLGVDSQALGADNSDSLYDIKTSVSLKEYAAFGEATYKITDSIGLTAGARAFKYDEVNDTATRGLFGTNLSGSQRTSKDSGISPRAILTFQPDRNLLFSAQVSRGFRLGSSNDETPDQICGNQVIPSQYDPETLTNYELGVKSRFANGGVTANAAVYQIDYNDLQLNARLSNCTLSFITNGSKARTRGAELEVVLRPVNNLRLNFSGTFQDPKLTQDIPAFVAPLLPGVGKGTRLPGSPKETFNASFDYTIANIFDEFAAYFGGSFQYVGGLKTRIQDPDAFKNDSYNLGSFRVGIRSEDIELTLFIDNLTNERAQFSRERNNAGLQSFVRNVPRTIGVNFSSSF